MDTTGRNLASLVGRRPEERARVHRRARFRDLLIDNDARTVTLNGRRVSLTRTEFDLLSCLSSKPGKVVETHELLEHVEWSSYDNSIEVHISRLRRKLGESARAPRFIHTVRGHGYRFDPGTREILSPQAVEQLEFASQGRPIVYVSVDNTRTFHWVSRSVHRTLGFEPADLVGRSVYEFIHPEDVLYVRRIASEIDRGSSRVLSYRVAHRELGWVPVLLRSEAVYHGEEHVGVIGEWTFPMVPPELPAEAAQLESEPRPTYVELLYDAESILRSVSPSEPFFGWHPDAVVGSPFHLFADRPEIDDESGVVTVASAKQFRRIAERLGPIRLEMQRPITHADGGVLIVQASIHYLTNENGEFDGLHVTLRTN